MPNIVGGCLCGGVRYEGEAEPVMTAVCHCRDCQKHTSSAFSVLVVLPKGTLRTEGLDLAAFEHAGGSGQPVVRRFCPRCGSPVVADVAVTPGWEWLMAGTLDDPSWLRPQMNIFCSGAQPWVSMDEAVPAHAGRRRWADDRAGAPPMARRGYANFLESPLGEGRRLQPSMGLGE